MREEIILNAINDLDSIHCMIRDIHESIYQDSPDYWTRLEHQYAGQFMQAMISSSNYIDVSEEAMADASFRMAHALVEKLKEKEERK